MTATIGKSIFIWQIAGCFGGDVNRIASEVAAAGFESAILHNSSLGYWMSEARLSLVKALRAAGVRPVGSAAVYGSAPQADGKLAADICNACGLDAFVFDAESKFDAAPNSDSAASTMLRAFHAGTTALAGWCWWPMYQSASGKVTWHPKGVLWAATDARYGNADFGMPMMYWSWGDAAADAIAYGQESWRQWRAITAKPLIPVGRAYVGDGGTAKAAAMTAFEGWARDMGAEGVSWWSLQHALNTSALPGVWDALRAMPSYANDPAPESEPQSWAEALDAWARTQGYNGPRPE